MSICKPSKPLTISNAKTSNCVFVKGQLMSIVDDATLEASNSSIVGIELSSPIGVLTSLQTASLIYARAAQEVFPGEAFVVRHAFGVELTSLACGYYAEINGYDLSDPQYAPKIEKIIKIARRLVEANLPIEFEVIPFDKLRERLQAQGCFMSLSFIDTENSPFYDCYTLDGYTVLRSHPLTPTTNVFGQFDDLVLLQYHHGLVVSLRSIPRHTRCSALNGAFDRGLKWGIVREESCIGFVNKHIIHGKPHKFVAIQEKRFDGEVMHCAEAIKNRKLQTGSEVKLILIAGPSASGKTTFAAKLSLSLRTLGFEPHVLGTDDYYRDIREPDYPRNADGKLDHECVEALRLDVLNDHLTALFDGREIEVPIFDFVKSRPKENGRKMTLPPNGVLIMEGIFSLDPRMTAKLPDDRKFKIFIVPLPQTNIYESQFLSNQTVRTLRRISRDHLHRGRGAAASIARLQSVRSGEERNIFPTLVNADFVFNSYSSHELSVLSVYCKPLLEVVGVSDPTYPEAQLLIKTLDKILPISDNAVSSDSLLREFIGDSAFEVDPVQIRSQTTGDGRVIGKFVQVTDGFDLTAKTVQDAVDLVLEDEHHVMKKRDSWCAVRISSALRGLAGADADADGGDSHRTSSAAGESGGEVKHVDPSRVFVPGLGESTHSEHASPLAEESSAAVEASEARRLSAGSFVYEQRTTDEDGTVRHDQIIAALINCEMLPLRYPINPLQRSAFVAPVYTLSNPGFQVYRATVTFLMHVAMKLTYPELNVVIPHGFGAEGSRLSSAYFVQVFEDIERGELARNWSKNCVDAVLARMRELVNDAAGITYEVVSTAEAESYFTTTKQFMSRELVLSRNLMAVPLAVCCGIKTLMLQPLAPDFSFVQHFNLVPFGMESSMAICFPTLENPTVVAGPPLLTPQLQMLEDYRNEVIDAQRVCCVGQVNRAVFEGQSDTMVRITECLSTLRMRRLVRRVVQNKIRVVMVAGPSSSGKSVFSRQLVLELESNGIEARMVSMDNYYRNLADPDYPLTASGDKDCESIEALRLELLEAHITSLLAGNSVSSPTFDLGVGRILDLEIKIEGLPPDGVLVMEGLFAINDKLLPSVPRSQKLLVLVTPLPLVNLDELRFTSNQVLRTLRRIARDYRARGRDARETLTRWGSVGEGEERNTIPFMSKADIIINASSCFEIGAIRSHVTTLLERVIFQYPREYTQAVQLLKMLSWYHDVPNAQLHQSSMMHDALVGESYH